MPELTITHSDGSTETIPKTVHWDRKRELGHMRRVTIDVERSDAQTVTLEPKSDKIALGSIDTVRLVDVETGGATWQLVCYSFEWDGNKAGFTPGGDLREGTDQTIANGVIGEVDSWTAGTVENHTGSLSFVFNHAHRHEALRRMERNVPGEFQFRDEGTVDYVKDLGSDRTASVEISTSAGTVEDRVEITKRGRELDGTHIRVLGTGEGEAQFFANLVPASDPATYTNRVDYTTSRWSDDSDTDWDRWQNQDVADQATLEEEAAAIGEEITKGLVEAKATVVDVDLNIGDWVRVVKPDADLDRDMRVHRITTIQKGPTKTHECLFSTRTTVRKGDAQELEDIQRFNTAFQGDKVSPNISGGLQSVANTHDYTFKAQYYDDVAFEHKLDVRVVGEAFRMNTNAASVVNGPTGIADQDSIGESPETLNTSWQTIGSFTSLPDDAQNTFFSGWIQNDNSSSLYIYIRTEDTSGSHVPNSTGWTIRIEADDMGFFWFAGGPRDSGEQFDIQMKTSATDSASIRQQSFQTRTFHDHKPDPGIRKFDGSEGYGGDPHFPSNCDVLINGVSQGVSFGDGTGRFEETVGVKGELTAGSNEITVTSDSRGDIHAYLEGDIYRKIL